MDVRQGATLKNSMRPVKVYRRSRWMNARLEGIRYGELFMFMDTGERYRACANGTLTAAGVGTIRALRDFTAEGVNDAAATA